MTMMVRPARFSEAAYPQLLDSVRAYLAQSAEALLAAGELFTQMLAFESAEKIAEDTDLTAAAVRRYAQVATFWSGVRIGSNTAGRPAAYALYDRVALDPLMEPEEKRDVRRHARRGRHVVERLVDEFRAAHTSTKQFRSGVVQAAVTGLVHAEQRLARVQPGDVDGPTVDEMQALVTTMAGHVDLLKAAGNR